MRVMIITDAWHPQINGVVRTYEHLIETITSEYHKEIDIHLISPLDFKYHFTLPAYPEIRLCLLPKKHLHDLIAHHNPTAIHIATEGTLGWAARSICMKRNIPFTTAYHTHFPYYISKRLKGIFKIFAPTAEKIIIALLRHFHKTSSAIMVTTQTMQQELTQWAFPALQMKIMTRGIDHDIFYMDDKKHNDLFKDFKRPVALYVGRVAIEKNLSAFLDAPWDGSKVIIGQGPDLEKLKQSYPTAHFLGAKSGKELGDSYRAADIFVFPSLTDTFGMVLTEAMACGLPIAAYPVTGPNDIVTQDFLGALNDSLSTAMQQAYILSKDSTLKQQRAHYAKQKYSWKIAAMQFIAPFWKLRD